MDTAQTRPNKLRRARYLVAAALVLFATVVGLSRISFDVDILKMLPAELPQVRGLGLFLKHFAQADQLILTIESTSAETTDSVADAVAERLRQREDLVRSVVSEPPWESRAGNFKEIAAYLSLNSSEAAFRALHHRLSRENREEALKAALERIADSVVPREVALSGYDPYGFLAAFFESGVGLPSEGSEFASADGTFRVLYVHARHPFANYTETIAWMNSIKGAVSEWSRMPGVTLGFTGEPSFVSDISGSMEWDMKSSSFVTLLLIAVIFWACYRRMAPLLGLQLMLFVIFVLTLGMAGLFLKQLTIMGVGCAAILIGLSVDYGYFVYQRSLEHSGTAAQLRSQCWQYIAWTSGTTAAAFFSFNLSSLPGLSQLGNLVGIGVIIGACVMLLFFAPLALSYRKQGHAGKASMVQNILTSPGLMKGGLYLTLGLCACLVFVLGLKGFPKVEFAPGYLRPRHSEAYDALEKMSSKLAGKEELLHLVVEGESEEEVLTRLQALEELLVEAKKEGCLASYLSPLLIWPNLTSQRSNMESVAGILLEEPSLREAAIKAGFSEEAFLLAGGILSQWREWAQRPPDTFPIWPESESSRWILSRLAHRSPGKYLASGFLSPAPGREDEVIRSVQLPGVYLVSWSQLGKHLQKIVPRELIGIMLALSTLVLLLLGFALRDFWSLVCFVFSTVLVLACLAAVMSLMGMTWNIFNIASILLLLGTGTDYSILMLLSLRRNGGDVKATQKELFLVICLCAGSAAAGFGTISWANHLGLAIMGQTCAIGLVIDALVSLFLLPALWKLTHPRRAQECA